MLCIMYVNYLVSKTPFTRYVFWIRVVTTSNSVSLRSYLLSPLFPWLVLVKFCNIIINLRATCTCHAGPCGPVPCKRGLS